MERTIVMVKIITIKTRSWKITNSSIIGDAPSGNQN
jgi:hypothetical protein